MDRSYYEWFSPALQRKMELLVFGTRGVRVLAFPTRMGRFYEYEDRGMVAALTRHIENGWLQLFCIDSVDEEGIYNTTIEPRSRITRHLQFEKYVLNEVIPFTEKHNDSPSLVSFGCSLGAYHAANVVFRHPQRFSKLLALSGRYDLTLQVESFTDLFSGHYDEDVYFNQPNHYLPGLDCGEIIKQLKRIDITLIVGENDPFLGSNQLLSEALHSKSVWHRLRIWPGRAHKWEAWEEMVQVYL